jgi:Protein of unknown function (DUF2752)
METITPGSPSTSRPAIAQRLGAIACGCSMVAAAALVAANDPAAAGSRFPGCTFHAITGLWCPGCGLTRGAHHLLNGDLAGAMSSNVFTPFALIAIVSAWWVWARRAFGRPMRNPVERVPTWFGPALLVLVLAYGVLRNIPIGGLQALAP